MSEAEYLLYILDPLRNMVDDAFIVWQRQEIVQMLSAVPSAARTAGIPRQHAAATAAPASDPICFSKAII